MNPILVNDLMALARQADAIADNLMRIQHEAGDDQRLIQALTALRRAEALMLEVATL